MHRLATLGLPDRWRIARPSVRELFSAALLAIALFALTLAVSMFRAGAPEQPGLAFLHYAGPAGTVIACVIVPICEEILFRESLPRSLAAAMPVHVAILLSAAAFAAIHIGIGWPGCIVLFVGGLLLSSAYDRFGNLSVPIIAHVLLNSAITAYTALT